MLFGKIIVVTGVASGIGQYTAKLAAHMGAEVIGIDVKKPNDPIGTFLQGDISTQEGVDQIVDALPDSIDALCNVAGVSGTGGAALTLAINFFGLKALSESLAPKIRTGGSIVNVASMAGYEWRENAQRASAIAKLSGFPEPSKLMENFEIPNELGYPISKEILLVWTMLAAHQPVFKSRNIRVNAVSPGPVETPILTQFRQVLGDERVNSDVERVGRSGTPSDIAPVILFLCSDAARWVNGNNIATDGGLEASVTADTLNL
ncbi:coniferyl-alcohol dehydrogenase [Marinomonas mediterranea]|jgi:Dehydrogenases with different specificities (related to short-chain alcohol dehydrogenases)|uniref:Alcohol dehydrogenase zinc-binding domain protein n=1 Tax=Marinomonas mediterranea (strain ATCC 700492 / JCM 21426 / NBRC 103028 / MMB-1) TaxID=717774 RepID=F2JZR1_MARM1|nr:coniferyl-alcohol dehydrogenase [Marinomonas mediterranea]ADZ90915.1 Alcohol dehydrogenase zinc-binding domain protein [Marinomonas mediterranea MMB-1]WCN08959.1 SDR family oxidoreductase [Marinomonas mediterranea]WCN12991.1 SDR family oxidoreductase [Marinomonas mediterranea]WCN17060.1 SDR family oxidoreductase [Marinomonas mediterranea MMB-1]